VIASPIADDLALIERRIRELQVEWDKFFGGLEKKPPTDLKAQLEALIRKYAQAEIRNNTLRFRYMTLTARFSVLSELWNRRLRALEEGRSLYGVRPPPSSRETPAPAPGGPPAHPAEEAFRIRNAEGDVAAVRALYERFLDARRALGEAAPVRFDGFEKLIAQQASRLLSSQGARAVDFRLETKDGKVSIKAKPIL